MGQEFIIKSQPLEDKINQLLPSQGGFQAGVDLSASTTIIPIVDLTESAEGSNVREDIQKALSLANTTTFSARNSSVTAITTAGYFRIFGNAILSKNDAVNGTITITDGVTSKILYTIRGTGGDAGITALSYDFLVLLTAGDSVVIATNSVQCALEGVTRQIADINGNLITI